MNDLELGLRFLLSLIFGVLVGIERQWHHKTAGLKTNNLVALGATTFTIVSHLGFSNQAQVAGGVLTGIGFIGAGVIIRHGDSVQGVNSAATLWVTAAGGMAIGIGRYRLAGILLAFVLLSQMLTRSLSGWIDARSPAQYDESSSSEPAPDGESAEGAVGKSAAAGEPGGSKGNGIL
jgi:putative Mg2+ transporter-C (MgtC) family protein